MSMEDQKPKPQKKKKEDTPMVLKMLPPLPPLPAEMTEALLGSDKAESKYFKMGDGLWSICLTTVDKYGGSSKCAIEKAIKFMEDNFGDVVPIGKLEYATVRARFVKWVKPTVSQTLGRRAFLLPDTMYQVIAAVRGIVRGPMEMNARLFRPVIEAVITKCGEGKKLKRNGGDFKVSDDWINRLCQKLKMPYKAATTNKASLPMDWEAQGLVFQQRW
jgi:hypothetical protein